MGLLRIVIDDITRLEVDVVVNAANSSLMGGGGVDGAIHRAAGPALRAYNANLGGCPVGEARISPGFQLPARWIVSTVGPVWHGGDHREADVLRSCYRQVLTLAKEHRAKSIAIPAISTGVYGYPKREAAEIAVKVILDYLDDFDEIIACCFNEEDQGIYLDVCQPLVPVGLGSGASSGMSSALS